MPPASEAKPVKRSKLAKPSALQVRSLWQQYKRTGDRAARDRLIFALTPMVRHIVRRTVRALPPSCDLEDFLSAGIEALIQTIERYDPGKGASLEQYAWTRVQGAVIDELRRHDWAPRSLRRDERAINNARTAFASEHERQPDRRELAARLGMTAEELRRRLDQVALAEVGSLNALIQSDEGGAIERIDMLPSADRDADPEIMAERGAAKERFRAAFAQLGEQQREVAVLLYARGLNLREAGERLGVSESRICQVHTQLRSRLYEKLSGEAQLFAEIG
ncbi:MAG TPA: FliA/WhiG family RNA polymerase sigma factor [Solirubrobacteraceae bacterium]|jgi:RNA polymerase sigma factor for flagellar operon FliA|nr:FliA/WhiG family RNA polymerase sigma factor [Solirubrobacteraceae bacterium]